MSSKKIPVGIVGATGYTGYELLRLLFSHPQVEVKSIVSQKTVGESLAKVFPAFSGASLVFEALDASSISKKVKAVFLCLPHHESMEVAAAFLKKGVIVFDLSADFRLKNVKTYEKWYGNHGHPDLLKKSVYGLPEIYRKQIQKANLVACPGCYPTSIILPLAPLLKNKLIQIGSIICDSKSGVSGAGRGLKLPSLFGEVNEDFKAYGVMGHRHQPEIEQELSQLAQKDVSVCFTPHLVPMDRGMFSTLYVTTGKKMGLSEVRKVFEEFYKKEFFVKILPEEVFPNTKSVRGTNFCHINFSLNEKTGQLVLFSAIDNLTKGASGQALQCFNIRFGFDEKTGLEGISLFP